MCLRFVFLLITRGAGWLRLSRREKTWKAAEILILRHQLTVLQRRQPRRPRLNWAGRPHRSLHGAAPLKRLPEPVDPGLYRVRRQAHVDGMINEYHLVAGGRPAGRCSEPSPGGRAGAACLCRISWRRACGARPAASQASRG